MKRLAPALALLIGLVAGAFLRPLGSRLYHGPRAEPPADLTTPVPERQEEHARIMARLADGPPDVPVALVGDSITAGWPPDLADATFGPGSANLGVGWDRVENVLWRVRAGELAGFRAARVVVLIGSNNLDRGDDPAAVAAGVRALLADIRQRQPAARLLLLAVLPRGQSFTDPIRPRIRAANELLAVLAREVGAAFLDAGPAFLLASGDIDPALMPDFLHPNRRGYEALAAAVRTSSP